MNFYQMIDSVNPRYKLVFFYFSCKSLHRWRFYTDSFAISAMILTQNEHMVFQQTSYGVLQPGIKCCWLDFRVNNLSGDAAVHLLSGSIKMYKYVEVLKCICKMGLPQPTYLLFEFLLIYKKINRKKKPFFSHHKKKS